MIRQFNWNYIKNNKTWSPSIISCIVPNFLCAFKFHILSCKSNASSVLNSPLSEHTSLSKLALICQIISHENMPKVVISRETCRIRMR